MSDYNNSTDDTDSQDIYDPVFVRRLFDEMSRTYGVVNLISSFGFCSRWRRQCIDAISIHQGSVVLDLMTGMGELLPGLSRRIGPSGALIAVDISPEMCRQAQETSAKLNVIDGTTILREDALELPSIEDSSVDYIVSSFGLKTFSVRQLEALAGQVCRVLKPGGQFSFLEISVPESCLMRWPYMLYLNHLIPLIGQTLMGNPDNYRLLGVYTAAFTSCRTAAPAFMATGLEVSYQEYFVGCASGLTGYKP
ncbi:MAG: class I SAM-dependent methyltransferase [Phycisphaeraceae bacterium]